MGEGKPPVGKGFIGVGHHPQAPSLVVSPFSFSNLFEVITDGTLGPQARGWVGIRLNAEPNP